MDKNLRPVDIIIPTYNHPQMLAQCIASMFATRLWWPMRIIVVNNGHPESLNGVPQHNDLEIVQTGGQNLGWEEGLKKGLERSNSEFVMFANDDIFIPAASCTWLRMMLEVFRWTNVAAVGPSSNVVLGMQNIWKMTPHNVLQTTFLIGFCMLVRRKMLDEVGGIDQTVPGGDDLDLSIRLRSKGYDLAIRRDVFVYHHGFVTGQSLYGSPERKGGWNSKEQTEATDNFLIKKHGFKKWFECRAGLEYPGLRKGDDDEGDKVRSYIVGEKVLDLACANNKTVPNAVGVDIVPNGKPIQFLNANSESDVCADVQKPLPFPEESQDTVIARHILEHCIDLVATLRQWRKVLRTGGQLIIAVPDERQFHSVPLNGEHVHAFTPDALENLLKLVGFRPLECVDTNGASIVFAAEKVETSDEIGRVLTDISSKAGVV